MKKILIYSALFIFGFFFCGFTYASFEIDVTPPQVSDFPITVPNIDKNTIQCYPGSNQNPDWVIMPRKIVDTLCNDPNNAPFDAECAGADLAKETTQARACWWKTQKKFKAVVNTMNMVNNGCCANCDNGNCSACGGINYQNPGGYSVYFMADMAKTANFQQKNYFLTKNLNQLILASDFATDGFSSGSCPSNIPADPYAGKDPAAFAYMNLIFNLEYNGIGSAGVFFQTILYDNRGLGPYDSTNGHINCGFPNSSGTRQIVIDFPINHWGALMTGPGQGTTHYEWDVLPALISAIKTCETGVNPIIPGYDLRLTSMFLGNELVNATAMTNTFTNPMVKLMTKEYLPIGYNELDNQQYCQIKGWTCDPNNSQQALNVSIFEGTNLLAKTTANFDRGAAVGNLCSGNSFHGYYYTFPAGSPVWDGNLHTITARAGDINPLGSETGILTPLTPIPYPTTTFRCPTLTPTLAPSNTPIPTPTATLTPTPVFSCMTCPAGMPLKSAGNANCDGKINAMDFAMWKNVYTGAGLITEAMKAAVDFNCQTGQSSHTTDLLDFQIWAGNYR